MEYNLRPRAGSNGNSVMVNGNGNDGDNNGQNGGVGQQQQQHQGMVQNGGNDAMIAQLIAIQQQQLVFQQQQVVSERKKLAIQLAGSAPLFDGTTRDIRVYIWINSLESWYKAALIENDVEKLQVVQSRLTGVALQWWTTAKARAKVDDYNTWDKVKEAIRMEFSPQDIQDWVRDEIKKLTSKEHSDVIGYNDKFRVLNQVLEELPERDRIRSYQDGLADGYRVKSKENKPATVVDAMEQTLVRYKARSLSCTTKQKSSGSTTAVNQIVSNEENKMEEEVDALDGKGVSNNNKALDALNEKVEKLTAMFTTGQNRGGGSARGGYRGGFNNYRGGGNFNHRGGRGGYDGNRTRNENTFKRKRPASRSPSREREVGIPQGVIYDRILRGACIRCNEMGHYRGDCPNAPKPSN